jgi:hypothetical protein
MENELTKDAHSGSVLARLLRDEGIIILLIKQDILTSVLIQKAGLPDLKIVGENELELNRVIYDLLLLDRCSNKEETIDIYEKIVEDCSKMLSEFPSMSVDEMAINCYLEVKKVRRW